MTAITKERIAELRRDWAPADDTMGRADIFECLDAVEKLLCERNTCMCEDCPDNGPARYCQDCADKIALRCEALEAENARLRAALGGLVHAVDELDRGSDEYDLRVREARAALAREGE